jgi:hypothetical protein
MVTVKPQPQHAVLPASRAARILTVEFVVLFQVAVLFARK